MAGFRYKSVAKTIVPVGYPQAPTEYDFLKWLYFIKYRKGYNESIFLPDAMSDKKKQKKSN